MNAKNQKRRFLSLILFKLAFVLLATSCGTTAPQNIETQLVTQDDLHLLEDAQERATTARENAAAAQAPTHFPTEWAQAEAEFEAGLNAGRDTLDAVRQGTERFTVAADIYETIAENSAPLAERAAAEARRVAEAEAAEARRVAEAEAAAARRAAEADAATARRDLDAAIARARRSRQEA